MSEQLDGKQIKNISVAAGKLVASSNGASSTPADPATTTDTTGKMMGLAIAVTPTFSTKLRVTIDGDIDNSAGGDGCKVTMRWGTGTAPVNGAALAGTIVGASPIYLQANATGLLGLSFTPGRGIFSLTRNITGLTLGVAYWIDISLAAVTGGTARVRNITVTITEEVL